MQSRRCMTTLNSALYIFLTLSICHVDQIMEQHKKQTAYSFRISLHENCMAIIPTDKLGKSLTRRLEFLNLSLIEWNSLNYRFRC